ncbi:NUDIX domain-containing protein [Paenibacillus sp. GCM10023248]|uniref:NUDIX hydrolase n=1 Tax=Bacillales TaxID=1385 RepID=UPI0023799069|nr:MULTISPECIES: NUDIX domain-containing protein [Bacillales]MDD9267990.1 NUDIX domain-containing protein [Paenibacillus sp. MAHUQ-63]MDR6879662.1 isopentenyldiphosphate isomerase [Bacillus sp. 3255]
MSKQEELFDIYDDKMNWLGAAPRSEVHANGYWHCTFQCWIISMEEEEPALLLQLRHPDKDLFPNLLDISCAGHLAAGETVADGARELEEELGLHVDFSELVPCGIFAEEDLVSDLLIDREYCHVFLYRCDQPLSQYKLQADEVTALFKVSAAGLERLVHGEAQQLEARGVRSGENGRLEPAELVVTLDKVVPHPAAYYDLVFNSLRKHGLLI